MRVAGVDGRRGGWVVAVVDLGARSPVLADLRYDDRLGPVLAEPGLDVIAIDMPIGLPGREGTRACDVGARRALRPYSSRVFPAPVRAVLPHASDYRAACAASIATCGKALSKQTWNLVPAITEVDAAAVDARLVECHPELSFAVLAGAPIEAVKTTHEGRRRRLEALLGWLADIEEPAYGADGLDALACAWTASRVASGAALTLPAGEVPCDERGRPMRIVV